MSSTNGHTQRRVPYKTGQFVVVNNVWEGEVDGPHEMKRDGYKIEKQGRRVVKVFDSFAEAEKYAEQAITENVERFGDI